MAACRVVVWWVGVETCSWVAGGGDEGGTEMEMKVVLRQLVSAWDGDGLAWLCGLWDDHGDGERRLKMVV
ncbi:hypothetical protein Tco_0810311 [Tanacetum coccineum]